MQFIKQKRAAFVKNSKSHCAFKFFVTILIFLSVFISSYAFANQSNFTQQCPKLLNIADDFARECLANARTQERYFAPSGTVAQEKEVHSAYFREAAPGSHFALGCTLNAQRNIDYFGIYYSVDGNNFKSANTAPIRYIDFNGNVGITVNNEPVNLPIVRQFGTETFPPHFEAGTIKNCEDARGANGEIKDLITRFHLERTSSKKNILIKTCIGDDCHFDQSGNYAKFIAKKDAQIIYHNMAFAYFIESNGDFLVREDFSKIKLCRRCV